MDYIRSGTVHYTLQAEPLPLVDQNGKPITAKENWEAGERAYNEACDRIEREVQRLKLERRAKWQGRFDRLLPCFARGPTVG